MEALSRGLALGVFAAVLLAAARVVARPERGEPVHGALSVAVWTAFLVVASVVALSLFRALTTALLVLTASVAWLAAPAAAAAFGGRPPPDGARTPTDATSARARCRSAPHALGVAAVVAPAAAFGLLSAVVVVTTAEPGADNLAYHLPRLGYWAQRGAVEPFVAGNARAGSFAPVGNVLQLPPVLFLGTDRLCALVQLAAAYGTALAVFGIARLLGASRVAAAVAAVAWLAIPTVAIQATQSQVDVTVAFFCAAATYFALRLRASGTGRDAVTALVAAGLAVGTKTHAVVLVGPLAAYTLTRLRRHTAPALLAAAVAAGAVACAAPYFVENAAVWGHPTGAESVRSVVVGPGVTTLAKNAAFALAPALHWDWLRTRPDEPPPGWRTAVAGDGLGLAWLVLVGTAGAIGLATRGGAAGRSGASGGWAAVVALGLGSAVVFFAVLRHTSSAGRYALASAAILTATIAPAVDALGRWRAWAGRVAVAAALLSASAVLGLTAHATWRARHPGGGALSEADRYGPSLAPVARALDALGPEGARVGAVTSQYFAERLLFGVRFQHEVVPLSYEPPTSVAAAARRGLDALWVSTPPDCVVQLFRREPDPAPRPPPARSFSFRRTPWGYDEDFVEAHSRAVVYVDVRPTIRAFAGAESGWHVATAGPEGVLFARGPGAASGGAVPCAEAAG